MLDINVLLDTKEFTQKPNGSDVKKISQRILKLKSKLPIEELAVEIAEKGRSVVCADISTGQPLKSTARINMQQIVMLDFDNKKEPYYTIKDLEQDAFMQQNASFYYRTFSDKDSDVDKFRVVFLLDPIKFYAKDVDISYQQLFTRYPQSDTSVGQTNRIFFGSNDGFTEINFKNKLDRNHHTFLLQEVDKHLVTNTDIPIYELFKQKKYGVLRERFGNKYSAEFPDEIAAGNYFKRLDMVEFLELPKEQPFLDVMHKETNPSAGVFKSDIDDIYLYKCFSRSSEFIGDITRVMKFLIDSKSFTEVVRILVGVTNCKIDYTSELGKAKLDAQELKRQLRTGELKRSQKELYAYLNPYKDELMVVLDIMFDYTFIDRTAENGERYLNYLSVDRLTAILNHDNKKKISRDKVWNVLNVIVVTELVQKLEISKIPSELFEDIVKKQLNTTEQIRHSTFYEPRMNLENSYEIAKILKENNVTVSSLSFELVYRLFSEEKAKKDFPQAYQPLHDRGIVNLDMGNGIIPKKSLDLEKDFVTVIMKLLKKKGYCSEREVVEQVAKDKKKATISINKSFSKMRFDIYAKYNLETVRNTKDLHKKLKMKEKYSPKMIILERKD